MSLENALEEAIASSSAHLRLVSMTDCSSTGCAAESCFGADALTRAEQKQAASGEEATVSQLLHQPFVSNTTMKTVLSRKCSFATRSHNCTKEPEVIRVALRTLKEYYRLRGSATKDVRCSLCFARVLLVELVVLKWWLCEELDKCSQSLAFWKDMELRPFRLWVITRNNPPPRIIMLERSMSTLIRYLGKVEKRFHEFESAPSGTEIRLAVSRTYHCLDLFTQVCFGARKSRSKSCRGKGKNCSFCSVITCPTSSLCIPVQIEFFLRELRSSMHGFVNRSIRNGNLQYPSCWRIHWPEITLGAVFASIVSYSFASGAAIKWLNNTSISRKNTQRAWQASTQNVLFGGGKPVWEVVLEMFGKLKKKGTNWLNKKVLQHVTVPTRNLINELINHKQLTAQIELFNEDDAEDLKFCEQRLEELLKEQFEMKQDKHKDFLTSSESSRTSRFFKLAALVDPTGWVARYSNRAQVFNKEHLGEPVIGSSLTERSTGSSSVHSVTNDFEQLAKDPFASIVWRGRETNVLRPVTINFYFIKVEMLYVLKALDYLLKGTNFNFELLATVPAIVAVSYLANRVYLTLFNRASERRSAVEITQRVRFLFRDIDQLLNRYDYNDDNHVGRYSLLIHQLDETLRKNLWQHLQRKEEKSIEILLDGLSSPFHPEIASKLVSQLFSGLENL